MPSRMQTSSQKVLLPLTEKESSLFDEGLLEKARLGDNLAIMSVNGCVLSRRRRDSVEELTSEQSTGIVPNSYEVMAAENFIATSMSLAKNKARIPNIVTQTKIFEVTKQERRPFYESWTDVLVNFDNIYVQKRFEQLNQHDLTGWLMLLKFSGEDMIARFTAYEFLKALGKSDSETNYIWLAKFLDRIGSSQIAIIKKSNTPKDRERFRGSLAPVSYERGAGGGRLHAVQLYKPMAVFLGIDGWSYLDIEQRLSLGSSQWAQSFHAYLATQSCPKTGYWWKKGDLFTWWGTSYSEYQTFIKEFRRRVLKPLVEIGVITKVAEKKTAMGLWWKG